MQNTTKKMDITFDKNAPSVVINLEDYFNGFKDILSRGGKIRCITEVTLENVIYCKELLNIVSELRHLDDFQGGFAISESEYMTNLIFRRNNC